MKKICVVHYGEIAIKGQNRVFFERRLIKNIKRAVNAGDYEDIQRLRGRIVLVLSGTASEDLLTARLGNVFGIANFSFGVVIDRDLQVMKEMAWRLLEALEFSSFAVRTRRAQKNFELNSVEVNREVGAYLQERCGKRVDLKHPDATVHIEITEDAAFVFTRKLPGLRGLPVGVSEHAVSLLSSGIDSPVASYLMLKRGVQLVYAHFHSQPYTSKASQDNTERLVEELARLQYYAKAYFIPFIDIQKEIMAKAPPALRVLLYRRYMIRLSERVAAIERCRALVTGENVAQVASQTLSNIGAVSEVATLPILRPLAGFDKMEIVDMAKRIGTYEISTAPYEDCCTLFVPDKPATKAHADRLRAAEKLLEMEALLEDAMQRAEVKVFRHEVERGNPTQ